MHRPLYRLLVLTAFPVAAAVWAGMPGAGAQAPVPPAEPCSSRGRSRPPGRTASAPAAFGWSPPWVQNAQLVAGGEAELRVLAQAASKDPERGAQIVAGNLDAASGRSSAPATAPG